MSPRSPKDGKKFDDLDKMIAEITIDSYGDDEQLWAFRQAFEDDVSLASRALCRGGANISTATLAEPGGQPGRAISH